MINHQQVVIYSLFKKTERKIKIDYKKKNYLKTQNVTKTNMLSVNVINNTKHRQQQYNNINNIL